MANLEAFPHRDTVVMLEAGTEAHRRLVCRHEAAHAVVAYATGLVVAPMGVRVDGVRHPTAHGICYVGAYHGGPPSPRSVAGMSAAGRLYGGAEGDLPVDADLLMRWQAMARGGAGTGDDLEVTFAQLLREAPNADDFAIYRAYRRLEADVLAVLARPEVRRSIEAVAEGLFTRGRLRPDEAVALIEPGALALAPQFARTLEDLCTAGKPVFLSFSGGKESVVLADLCQPWRERITLLWTNTGHMAPHMVEFVRGYGERFRLVELRPHDLLHHWEAAGIPADIVPAANGMGWAEPRLQSWLSCCFVNRQKPINDFLASQGPCVYLNGQRRADRGASALTLRSQMTENVEVAAPLWEWTTDDVMAWVADRWLALPAHYGEFSDSLECLISPAAMTPERLRYLDRHAPETAAETVRPLLRSIQEAASVAAEEMYEMLAEPEASPVHSMKPAA